MREVANGLVCMYRTNTSKAEHFHSWLRTAANDVIGYLNGQSVNHFVAASFFPFDQKMCFPRQSEWKLRNLCLLRGKSPWKVSNKNKRTHQYVSSMPSKLVSCWMSNMANHFFFLQPLLLIHRLIEMVNCDNGSHLCAHKSSSHDKSMWVWFFFRFDHGSNASNGIRMCFLL